VKQEFGPNQDRVDGVLERLDVITHEMAMFLGTFDPDAPERRHARDAMRRAAATGGREPAIRAAQREVEAWVNRWFAGGPMIAGYGRDTTPAEAGARAAPAILDAVGATVVADLLREDDLDVLTAPWRALWDGR
jgi:hypothetical protein